ncbi:MAG: hypothetical protein ABWZ99_07115 [Ilumatobacteraceae bacterium]
MIIGTLMLVVGALLWLDATRRSRRAVVAIREGTDVPVPVRAIQVVWAATVLVIAAALVIEVAQ